MYENWLVKTHPGTEMKVTPDMEVPIMAMDTKYQGDLRLPIKKVSLLELREVK